MFHSLENQRLEHDSVAFPEAIVLVVEAAAAQVLRKNRDAAIRQSVVLKAVRGEVTASVAADQCGVRCF